MHNHNVKMIYASTPQGVIGNAGKLPWHIPEDLTLFKEKTLNATVLMGRKTYESLPSSIRPMPNRTNVVVSRNKTLKIPGVKLIHDPVDFIFRSKVPIWVIGGGELYRQVQHLCSELHHTEVLAQFDGDARFEMNLDGWDLVGDTGELVSSTGTHYRVRHWEIPLVLARYSGIR